DPRHLTATLTIDPEYLKTDFDRGATNYRDWGIQLGRRFRALKLWFVLRHYGVEGLRAKLREHLALAREAARWIEESDDFELLAPVPLNTICFRFHPGRAREASGAPAALPGGGPGSPGAGAAGEADLDELNRALLARVNEGGRIFITHTRLGGRYCLRMSIGQTSTRREHVEQAWSWIRECAANLGWRGRGAAR
ncbi:MAG: hypothetical protein FJY75_13175, partial [Candidatus Eisenbacteria bacterium]|nr:hypothetical protein [Candidatus Eisenbacteria bacterium]